jgi:hypothetical protein
VNDANVPQSGGRITCPSCSHKFVVYPDQDESPQQGGQAPAPDPDKTSVVERPNLGDLAGAMQGGGAPPEQQDDAPATEVMSGDALSGMFGGQDPAENDGTVEMQNPYSDAGGQGGPPEEEFDVAATEVVSGDAVGGMFDSIQKNSGTKKGGGQQQGRQSQQQPPAQPEQVDSEATVESSPPDLNSWTPDSQQQDQGSNPPHQGGGGRRSTGQAEQQRPGTPPVQGQSKQPSTPSGQQHGGRADQRPAGGGGQPPSSQGLGASPAAGTSNEGIQEFSADPEPPEESPAQPAQPAQDAASAGGAGDGPSADYDGPWKLKTNFGLTYEFPDTSGLKNWLSNREELDGYQLAGEDGDFRPLNDWPQIGGDAPGPSVSQQMPSFDKGAGGGPPASQPGSQSAASSPGGISSGPGSGPNQPPSQPASAATQPPSEGAPDQKDSIPPGKKINPQEFRPPSQEAKWNKVLWVVFLVLAVVATGIGLQTFEIYDVKGLILGESSNNQTAQTPPTKPGPKDKASAADEGDEKSEKAAAAKEREERLNKQIEQLLGDAKRARENNRLQTALDKLERAKKLDPERPEVFEMKATVFEEMGQADEAKSAKEKAKQLREQSLSKNEKAADGAEKSEN